jgi:hypothetical protein
VRTVKLLALLGLVLLAVRVIPTTLPRSSRVGGPGYGLPPADTGNPLLDWISDFLISLVHVERRVDPFFRPLIEAFVQAPLAELIMKMVNMRRTDEGFALAEERALPNEEAYIQSIIDTFSAQMRRNFNPGYYQRGGNTKTHGVLRAELTVRDDLPEHMRRGLFAKPATYKAWVRYSGPGPFVTPDIDDVGFMSMAIKIIGVPGPKLMDDEKFTLDMFGTSVPTFVSPDIKTNAELQKWSYKNAPLYYFLNPKDSHILDAIMQGLWTKTQTSPIEGEYFSCVAYLLGEGQAMQYMFRPRLRTRTPVPRLPFRPPDNYLRDAMVATLAKQDVEFDILVQVQTDPFLMPIENGCVLWPTKLSPRVPAAVLRIPKQKFDSPEQLNFAHVLRFNPFHTIPEHRPLGNISRARQRMYYELAKLRQAMNNQEHIEPTGDETF